MVLVPHKYMVDEIPAEEVRATFAAREHTLEYLVNSLRGQMEAKTLTSYLITGPRGAGKTTLVRMLCFRIEEDLGLRDAWLPVRFPEELPGVTSLRDLLAVTLEQLAKQGIAQAQEACDRVQAENNDEQSEELAAGALKRISEQQGKRLILLIENLDQVFDGPIDKRSGGTLRRLLMVDPFMLIVGTAIRQFEALQRYDRAFFNYFCPVPLDRLNDEQVRTLLFKRAEFDGNTRFDEQYRRHQAKIQALTRLTGGNPRLLIMLYEVLGHGDFSSAVSALRELVDSLTPLLKDVIETQLSGQQGKIVDAIMRAGGTSTPAEIGRATRIALNSVTRQLQRLKDMQVVEVLGGGKGREAYYTVPDALFRTWYQMRYLRPHCRRIELFVEILRVWFETEQRLTMMRELAAKAVGADGKSSLDTGTAIEYFGASLADTPHDKEARETVLSCWLGLGRLDEAAMALAEGISLGTLDRPLYERGAYLGLAKWAIEHGDLATAADAARAALNRTPNDAEARIQLGSVLGSSGDYRSAFECFDQVVHSRPSDRKIAANALYNRGVSKGRLGDAQGALADYSAVIEMEGAAKGLVAEALVHRGGSKGRLGDAQGALADCSAAIEMEGASKHQVANALYNRGVSKGRLGDAQGELADYSAVIEMEGAPKDWVAKALVNRGVSKGELGDAQGALADYSAVIEMEGAAKGLVAEALFNRGVSKGRLGDAQGALADYSAVMRLEGAPREAVARALANRAAVKGRSGDVQGAITDCSTVITMEGSPKEQMAQALLNRGLGRRDLADAQGALADYLAATRLEGAPPKMIAQASWMAASLLLVLSRTSEGLQYLMRAIEEAELDMNTRVRAMERAFPIAFQERGQEGLDTVARSAIEGTATLSREERAEVFTGSLRALARPKMRDLWPRILRSLIAYQPADTGETLDFFRPVAEVLETGDLTRLDPLPPEQREFALEVLRKFEPAERPGPSGGASAPPPGADPKLDADSPESG